MPYKEDRPQLSLKFTPNEYAALQDEAARAGVPVNTYVRQLVLTRGPQPLSAEAEPVRRYYLSREEVHLELLDERRDATLQAREQREQFARLQQEVSLIHWGLTHNQPELVSDSLARALALANLPVTLPEGELPPLPPDVLATAPVAEPKKPA
ncbi:hypothetical protein DNI29_23010 [Hymenobacter sediminis]|uniref:plasmid mobilization protein n=1 Tax=Hymenobacter sediminis TaxID=2218621 RepID=UPI000DA6949D|nr:hypothetical protein [Hymenobacter sediminis]RPD43733.1 hypothetical protein DNI29_23010 [Hymenobacter sediminis]